MANVKLKPHYQIINGIRCPPMFPPTHVKEIMNYKPTPDDVFIVTYPKCGTTWMQNFALYIFRKGIEIEDRNDFHRMCPFLDPKGIQSIVNMPRPGAFKTHLPYNMMPYSPDAKYIFVLRNPKDVCVSLYYHAKHGGVDFSEGEFDDFFEVFMTGEVEFNDYFDHLASWYPHRNDKQIFYTTYEDMKEDPKNVILNLATFLGQEYIEAIEKDNNVLNNILNFSGFEYMKDKLTESVAADRTKKDGDRKGINQAETNFPYLSPSEKRRGFRKSHFRKGIVGDWKNHFSEEQSERLNQKFFERFGGTDIYEKYKPYM